MGLQPDEAIDDVDPGTLQGLRPGDVGGLVEPCLELDQHSNLNTAFGGAHQASGDGAVATGTVQRHLDALYPRVVGRLGDERLGAAGEALVWVMNHQRALADDREDAAVGLFGGGNAPSGDWRPRPVLQIGSIERMELPQPGEIERSAMGSDIRWAELELAQEQLEHLFADPSLHLDAHGPTEASAPQFHLDRSQQVVGLFVFQGQVDVAGDPEHCVLLNDHADEQTVQLRGDQLFGEYEADPVRKAEQAGKDRRHLDPGKPSFSGIGIADHRRQAEGEVGDVRKRVSRIDSERCEHREDSLLEDVDEVRPVVGTECRPT